MGRYQYRYAMLRWQFVVKGHAEGLRAALIADCVRFSLSVERATLCFSYKILSAISRLSSNLLRRIRINTINTKGQK